MTRTLALTLAFSALGSAVAQCPTDRWELSWHDEFQGTTLNTSNWTAVSSDFHGNNELQYYTPLCVSVSGGKLVITASNHPLNGWQYRSGLVDTRGKRAQTYGRWEVGAKLPGTQGIWPAIWMLPDNGQWPPEIDIMELLGHEPTRVYHTNHWGVYPNNRSKTSITNGPDFTQTWNTFAVEWHPNRMDFFVNGELRGSHTEGLFDLPSYLILNTAVGGNWPGPPNGTTKFPQRMEVDWVRVYTRVQPTQQLTNPGFETSTTGWTKSGNAYSEAYYPRSGSRAGKMYGNFTGSPNTSVMSQEKPASAGQNWAGQSWWRNNSTDAMRGPNTASMRIEFLSASNTVLGTKVATTLTATSKMNEWRWSEVELLAPSGTTKARLSLVFSQPAMDAGAAFVDDVVFGPVACPEKPRLQSTEPQ